MKKIIPVMLVLMLCMSLCACDVPGKVDLPPVPTLEPEESPAADPAQEEVPTVPEEPENVRVTVTVGRSELEALDPENGTQRILYFAYETPSVNVDGNPEASDAINEYIAMLDETYYTGEDYGDGPGTGFNNMLTLAEDNYLYVRQSGMEGARIDLSADRSVKVMRADSGLICLLYNDYIDLGGAHGEYKYTGYCFDTSNGELLTLDKLSPDSEGLKSFLTDYMVTLASEDEYIRTAMEGFVEPEAVEDSLAALVREGSWYFDSEGMTVFSDLYEIGSYASGIVEFKIPYAELAGKVDAKYIPAASTADGCFRVVRADDMIDGSMEIIDMVKASDEGEHIYFAVDGSVEDVRISRVDYTGIFYETAQLWYCSEMSDCAVQLVTVIPEGMPDIMISYRTAEGTRKLYLTESGEDGSLILAGDSIEAVG